MPVLTAEILKLLITGVGTESTKSRGADLFLRV